VDEPDPVKEVCQSLSTFLVSVGLQACLFNSRMLLSGKKGGNDIRLLEKMFESDKQSTLSLHSPYVTYASDENCWHFDMYLWNDCMVCIQPGNHLFFAANHADAINFLSDNKNDDFYVLRDPLASGKK
jgi:hypothetical protein